MEEPQNFAMRDLRSGVHLSRASAGTFYNVIGQTAAKLDSSIVAATIDNNDFGVRCGRA